MLVISELWSIIIIYIYKKVSLQITAYNNIERE